MARTITVTFGDGSSHVYQNAPDDITPDAVAARAQADYPKQTVSSIDGGNKDSTSKLNTPQAPGIMDRVMGIPDAVATVASGVAGQAVSGIAGIGSVAKNLVQGKGIDAAMVAGADTQQKVAQAMYSPPETQTGADIVGGVAKVGGLLSKPSEMAGDKTLELTGSPAAATAVQSGVDALMMALTGGAPKVIARGAQAAGALATSAKVAQAVKMGGQAALADALEAKAAALADGPIKDGVTQAADKLRNAKPQDVPDVIADVMQPPVAWNDLSAHGASMVGSNAMKAVTNAAPTVGSVAVDAVKQGALSAISGKAGAINKLVVKALPDASPGVQQAATLALKTLGATHTLGTTAFLAVLGDAAVQLGAKLKAASPDIGAAMLARRAKQLVKERGLDEPDTSLGTALQTAGPSSMSLADGLSNGDNTQ